MAIIHFHMFLENIYCCLLDYYIHYDAQ